MAEIYRAQYSGIEGFAKEVVVKRLREEFAEREDIVEMFLDEARIAATLTHKNVVHTYDLGEIEGEYFIAMEYLQGCELVEALRAAGRSGAAIPLDVTVGILMQALEGLEYVHGRTDDEGAPLGLIHRDLNPTNIHVGFDGVCKIVDFGIAATRSKALAGAGRFAGKLGYMAPEQIHGAPLDGRADLFAMGVIMYEMTLRRRLFRGDAETLRARITTGDFDPPTYVDPEYPPALESIVMRALEVDPGDRFESADDLFRALEAFCQDEGLLPSARRIANYLSELDVEGAVALPEGAPEFDDDDEWDGDPTLDLSGFDGSVPEGQLPEWVSEAAARPESSGSDGRGRGRTMTLGSLTSLVEDGAVEVPREGAEGTSGPSGSGMHAVVTAQIEEDDSRPMARTEGAPGRVKGSGTRARRGSAGGARNARGRPRPSSRTPARSPRPAKTASSASTSAKRAVRAGAPELVSTSFGGTVVAEGNRGRGGTAAIVIGLVILVGIGYLVVSIMGQK